jgi:hypothetical protein
LIPSLKQQHLLNDIPLDNISLLVLFSSEVDRSSGQLSSFFKKNKESMIYSRYRNLKHLLLIDVNFDDKIEDFISISQLNLDLIYL